MPRKGMVIERYDPPVLIIHVRWHETAQSFGKLMHNLLYLSYAGNEDSVSAGPTGPGYHTRQPFRTDYAGRSPPQWPSTRGP